MISCPLAARYRLLIGHRDCMREGWRSCKRYRLRILMSVNYSTVAWHTRCRSSSVGKRSIPRFRFSGWVASATRNHSLIARLKRFVPCRMTCGQSRWLSAVYVDKYSWFIRLMPVTSWGAGGQVTCIFLQDDKFGPCSILFLCTSWSGDMHLGLVTWHDKLSSLYMDLKGWKMLFINSFTCWKFQNEVEWKCLPIQGMPT